MDRIPILRSGDVEFPAVSSALAEPNGLLAIGGDLHPETLVKAYSAGIFPWFNEDDPILWWHPEPRMVAYPGRHTLSRSMRRLLASEKFAVTFDRDFERVVSLCASVARRGERPGSWITSDLARAYAKLHRMGIAHSVEARIGGELAGGLYGVALGGCFFGESMFHRIPNASKVAYVALSNFLRDAGYTLIDCQVPSTHLASLGAAEIGRSQFMAALGKALAVRADGGAWLRAMRGGDAAAHGMR